MILITDIVKEVTRVLKKEFNIPVYGDEIKEGYKTPSFFVGVFPISTTTETKNIAETELIVSISYFSDVKDSVTNYKVMDKLRRSFGIVLNVENRYLTIKDFEVNVTGEDKDIYQFTFTTSYKELINFESDADIEKAAGLHFRKVIY